MNGFEKHASSEAGLVVEIDKSLFCFKPTKTREECVFRVDYLWLWQTNAVFTLKEQAWIEGQLER